MKVHETWTSAPPSAHLSTGWESSAPLIETPICTHHTTTQLVTPSAACECDTEEETVVRVVLQCPIHRSPHGLHGLTILDDETIEWLLNTYPEI